MTTLDPLNPTYERIKMVQTQMRKAIQNHHLLLLKHEVQPSDPEVKKHLGAIQAFIISMGRTQKDLLAQLKKEFDCTNFDAKSISSSNKSLAKFLVWPDTPKHIPVYKPPPQQQLNNSNLTSGAGPEVKKIATWRPRRESVRTTSPSSFVRICPPVHAATKKQSLLKVNSDSPNGIVVKGKLEMNKKILLESSKVKIVVNKNENSTSLWRSKRMRSVLKSKRNEVGKRTSVTDVCSPQSSDNESAVKRFQKKSSPTSSLESLESDDIDCAEIIPLKSPPPRNGHVRFETTKILTKTNKFKCLPGSYSKNLRSESEQKEKKMKFDMEVAPIKIESYSPPQSLIAEELPSSWISMGDTGQDIFLGYLGLVSKAQFDVLKRKRCERKRRSVAGQSSMYNDYFQPPTPKRTYGPRKAVVLAEAAAAAAAAAVAAASAAASQVVVEVAAELEDEDEKPIKSEQNCSLCHSNVGGPLESCGSCGDSYHARCAALQPPSSNGCETCHTTPVTITNIVGANTASSASSTELIKRYLTADAPPNEANAPNLMPVIKEETEEEKVEKAS